MGSHLSFTFALPQHMDTQKYNGWTNHTTWLCSLWFNFDFTDDIADLSHDCHSKWLLIPLIENIIELYVEDYLDAVVDEKNGFVSDLIQSAYKDIDFRDLAEHYVDDVWDAIETHRLNQKEALAVA